VAPGAGRLFVVRIWDLDPALLCRSHLLGEHRELHAVWTILTEDRRGYRRHPETLRWEGKLAALHRRHEELVAEMTRRGYRHHTPLDPALATGAVVQDEYVDPPERQRELLRARGCGCLTEGDPR
jgi:Pyrimidine dimer DNA glycosylase